MLYRVMIYKSTRLNIAETRIFQQSCSNNLQSCRVCAALCPSLGRFMF